MADNDAASASSAPQAEVDHKSSLEQLEQTVKRAKEYLKVIEGTNKKAVDADGKLIELLAKAGEAQMKADNEALRASHAKGLVEEHSGAAAKLKGSMESDTAVIAKKRVEIEAIAQSFANLRSTSEADATAITSARKTADEAAKSVTETSGKAAAVQANISETKKSIEDLAQTVREGTKTITADVSQIAAGKETSATHLATMQKATTTCNELQERSKTALAAIESSEKSAKAKLDTVTDLTAKSVDLQAKVSEYETNLANLQSEFVAMKDKIEGLLPAATSAGLAASFAQQRAHYAREREGWATNMKWGLAFLTVTVAILAYVFPTGADSWGDVLRHLVQKIPFMVAPLWVVGYSGRQHMLATRMEEEYASKETISTSFDGYKREMESDPETAKMLSKNVLEIIARRPGMVYEGEHQDYTPLKPVAETVEKLVPSIADAIVAKLKGVVG